MSYKIYLVRHGQTILNRYNRMQGWCDSPLTQKGIEDAHEAGRRLKKIRFAYAFHSDTTRATMKRPFRSRLKISVNKATAITKDPIPTRPG